METINREQAEDFTGLAKNLGQIVSGFAKLNKNRAKQIKENFSKYSDKKRKLYEKLVVLINSFAEIRRFMQNFKATRRA